MGEAGLTFVPGSPTAGVGAAVSVAVAPVGVSPVTEPLAAVPVAEVPAAALVIGDVALPGVPALSVVRTKPFLSGPRAMHPVSVMLDGDADDPVEGVAC